jgi:hypothetical protein
LFFTAKRIEIPTTKLENLKIMYSIARLTHNTGTMPLIEYEQLDNLLEVVFKKKADENSKLVTLANGRGINTVLDIIEVK